MHIFALPPETADKANQLLVQSINYLKKMESMEVIFVINVHDATDKQLGTQQGLAKVKKNKYEIMLGDQHVFSDGQTVWVYNKMLNEVQVDNYAKKKGSMFDVENLLNGGLEVKLFKSKLNGSTIINGVKYQELEMTPVDKTTPFFKALLWIDEKSSQIKQAKIFDKRGTRFVYIMQKFTKNPSFPIDFGKFISNKYKDVEVVDLR